MANEPENKEPEIDYKKKFEETKASMDAAKERARKAEEALSARDAADAERAKKEAAAKEAEEQGKLTTQAQFQEAIKNLETKHKQELEGVLGMVDRALVPSAIKEAAGKVKNIVTEAVPDLADTLSKYVKLDQKTFKPVVFGEDGKPLVDEKLAPVSVEAFVTSYVSKRPHLVRDTMPTGTGLKPGVGQGTQSFTVEQALADPTVMKAWEAADPEGSKKAFDDYYSPAACQARAAKGRK